MPSFQFQPGDVVRLKSGSPSLYVSRSYDAGDGMIFVKVTWYADETGFQHDDLPETVLVKYESPEKVKLSDLQKQQPR